MSNSTGRRRSREEVLKHPLRVDVTQRELEMEKFNGIYRDEIIGEYQIWLLGQCRKTVSDVQLALNPEALNEAMAELAKI